MLLLDHSVTACAPLAVPPAAGSPSLDSPSFAKLYEEHLPAVYRYISSRVSTREEAEDLTADAFRAAWTSRHAFRGRGTFRAWLFSIVRRTLADHYRHRQPATALQSETANSLQDHSPSPEDEALREEQHQTTRTLLEGLTREQQEVLSLRFAAELSYPEIAIVIGKREDAVKKIAHRALEAIRGRQLHAQPF